MKSWIARILAIGAIALIASACSPQDIKAYYQSIGVTITDAEANDQANAVNKFAAEQAQLHRFDYALSDPALGRLRAVLGDIAYNLVFHSAPYRAPEPYHWHVHIVPKLTTVAGFELGTGVLINIVNPEQAAEELSAQEPVASVG